VLEPLKAEWANVQATAETKRSGGDPCLQEAFLSLLACVVSCGGHAAIALRDRIVNSPAV
jgi:hypothetical protein